MLMKTSPDSGDSQPTLLADNLVADPKNVAFSLANLMKHFKSNANIVVQITQSFPQDDDYLAKALCKDSLQILAYIRQFTQLYRTRDEYTSLPDDQAMELLDLLDCVLRSESSETGQILFAGRSGPSAEARQQYYRCFVRLSEVKRQYATQMVLQGVSLTDMWPWTSGSFGDIYRGSYNNQAVALKTFRIFMKTHGRHSGSAPATHPMPYSKHIYREIAILRGVKHPCICPLIGVNLDALGRGPCLVMSWASNGNVEDFLVGFPWSERTALQLLVDTLDGLLYLHSLDVVHGDLHPGNILVGDDMRAQLTDFGFANFASLSEMSISGARACAIRYAAYELCDSSQGDAPGGNKTKHTPRSDLFSFGQVCWKIFTGLDPYDSLGNMAQVVGALVKGDPVQMHQPRERSPRTIPDYLWDAMLRFWSLNPDGRVGSVELYSDMRGAYSDQCTNVCSTGKARLCLYSPESVVDEHFFTATLSLLATQISGRTELYALVPRVFRKRISAKVLRNLHDNLKAVPHDATGSLTRLMEHLKGPNSIVELAEAHYPDNEHLVDAFHEDGRKIMAYVGRFTRSYRKEIQYEDLASKKAGLILDLLDSILRSESSKLGRLLFEGSLEPYAEARKEYHRCFVSLSLDARHVAPQSVLQGVSLDMLRPHCFGPHKYVFKAIYKNQEVAVQCFKRMMNVSNDEDRRVEIHHIYHEIAILRGMKHPRLCTLIGVCSPIELKSEGPCLVIPWAPHGSVADFFVDNPWSEALALRILSDCLDGLLYLHDMDIVHGNLHPGKILVGPCMRAQLAGFGMASFARLSVMSNSAAQMGAIRYSAYELSKKHLSDEASHAPQSDLFSFGQICWKIFTGTEPYPGIRSSMEVFVALIRGDTVPTHQPRGLSSRDIPDFLWDAMQAFWSLELHARVGARELLSALQAATSE